MAASTTAERKRLVPWVEKYRPDRHASFLPTFKCAQLCVCMRVE